MDPKDIAKVDDEYLEVLEVTDHKFIGNGKHIKDNLELKIRFENDRHSEWNAWSKDYNHVPIIQQYLKSKGLNKFILPQYRK